MTSRLVVMVGGPAAGKSTVASRIYGDLPRVDSDSIKETLDGYDPKNPQTVHRASVEEAVRQILGYLSRGESVVYDGTGTNLERLASMVSMARASGMKVEACLVSCSLALALRRNSLRERTVAQDIVMKKHKAVAESWPVIRSLVDEARVVDTEKS